MAERTSTGRWWTRDHWIRLVMWVLFGCVASLLPLAIQAIKGINSPGGPTFTAVCGNGELLIISAVIAAGVLGELILGLSRSPDVMFFLVLSFACGAELVIASLWYADLSDALTAAEISGATATDADPDHYAIAVSSTIMFGLTVLTGGFSMYAASRVKEG